MRKASFWLLGAFVLAASTALLMGTVAKAEAPVPQTFGLRALQDGFPLGGPAILEVSVPPSAIGGYAHLYATVGTDSRAVLSFSLVAPVFTVAAPVPADPALVGEPASFFYRAFGRSGQYLATSQSTRDPEVDPEAE